MRKIGKRWLVWDVTTSFQFPWFRKSLNDYWFFEVVLFHKCFNWSRMNSYQMNQEELESVEKFLEKVPYYKDRYENEKEKY